MEDQELIHKVKQEADDDSLLELIDRHSGVYLTMVDRYLSGASNSSERNDFIENKLLAIYNTVLQFDPSRNAKFPTYLANSTRWSCLNSLTRKKKVKESSLDEINKGREPRTDDLFVGIEEDEALFLFKDFVENSCDKKTKKIIDMRYNECFNRSTPWVRIAAEVGMSIQGVINIHNRCIADFKKNKKYV